MLVETWDVPVTAEWQKSNVLVDFAYSEDGLEIELVEGESKQQWLLQFEEILGFKVIRDEWSEWSAEPFPADGAFFEIVDSPWLEALGVTVSSLEDAPHHYIICCKRELLEVAAWECIFTAA